MRQWLRNRLQPVPGETGMDMAMPVSGSHGDTLMPSMLTEAQMQQLDQARSAEFDRLFLTFMIQHHHGAVVMVQNLFATYGAAQDRSEEHTSELQSLITISYAVFCLK